MSKALTIGSIQDVANNAGKPLAETFMSVDALIMFDRSLSMEDRDCPERQQRWEVAVRELRRLQAEIPGKIGVVQFSTFVEFIPGGMPDLPSGTTNMEAVLNFVKPVDRCGIKLILISDGEPDYAEGALNAARGFQTAIDTIYIGPSGGSGADFLRRLSALTGGRSETQSVREIPELARTLTRMLSA